VADYTPACLHIGGVISDDLDQDIQRLTEDEAEVSFGYLYEIGHDRTRGGEFEALEGYLVAQQIPFDRYSEPALGYDGRLAQFRPGMREPIEFTASGDNHERVVPVRTIQTLLDAYPPEGPLGEELARQLRALFGPTVAPLPKFLVQLG
jgi:hypothetical protein